jgi:cell wall-associated NlpC family hydrolase
VTSLSKRPLSFLDKCNSPVYVSQAKTDCLSCRPTSIDGVTRCAMDLAAKSYEGQVAADRFVEGEKYRVSADRLEFRPQPRQDISIDTEGLFGEKITVYEQTQEGWAWGQLETDGYVGWFSSDAIQKAEKPTHRVTALRTFRYPAPELKMPPLSLLSIGSLVSVAGEAETRGLRYAVLADGSAIVAKHLVPLGHTDADWVASAEALLGTPYLWGGAPVWGWIVLRSFNWRPRRAAYFCRGTATCRKQKPGLKYLSMTCRRLSVAISCFGKGTLGSSLLQTSCFMPTATR